MRNTALTCVVLIAGLAGCGGSGVGAAGPGRTVPAKASPAVSTPSRPTPGQWTPSPFGSDWVVFHGNCHYVMTAWSTFLSSYRGATSVPVKNLAAATAASDIANSAYDLVKKLPTDPEHQIVMTLSNRMEAFSQDFQIVEKDLQTGDTSAADSTIKTRLQSDENAVSSTCGPE